MFEVRNGTLLILDFKQTLFVLHEKRIIHVNLLKDAVIKMIQLCIQPLGVGSSGKGPDLVVCAPKVWGSNPWMQTILWAISHR